MAAITMLGLPTINLRRRRILMRSRCQILLVIFSTLLLLVVVVVMLISPSSATRLTRARAQTEAQRRQARQLSSAQPSRRISENKTLTTAINSTHKPLDDNTIRNAVHDWVTKTNKDDVIATYGHISDWDVSQVTDMSYLFTHARFLNEDLSRWQTDRVTDMKYMFAFASGFRGSPGFLDDDDTSVQYAPNAYTLRNWNTEKVTDMSFMFHHAIAFTGEGLTHWDVQNVVDMTYMFQGAKSFTENIWRWDTHKVRSMNRMFHNATKFAGSLCWPLHPDMVAVQTFCGSNHAGFQASCDIQHVLQSDINQKFHDCCSCEYSADEHYAHIEDDDDDNGSDSALDKKMGIILTSCIWVLVLVMLVVVIVFATPKRRHQVRHWLQINVMKSSTEEAPEQTRPRRRRREGSNSSGNNGNNYPSPALAPDGGVIATLVGPATTAHPRTPSNDGVTDTDTDIDRMVSTEIPNNNNHHNYDHNNDDSEVVVVDADHVQREEEVTTLSSPPWWIPDRNNVGTSSSTNNNDSSSSSNWVHAAATTVELPYDEEADLEKYNGMSLMC